MALPARSPAPTGPTQNAASPSGQIRRLKKGELLFSEGENSRAMYFLRSGMIRLYKKKGDSHIEIDTVHSGQILGELAFLDGNPRSASGEALTDCELMEISGPAFMQVLAKMPEWLKMLLKTVVGRLRTSSTRIRQLESASTAFDYSEKDGKRSAHYVYLSPTDVMKICTGILLVATRNGQNVGSGLEVRVGLLQRYANQIMGVPVAKITTLMDVLSECGLMSIATEQEGTKVILRDPDQLERLITYLNEENLLEPSKRHDLTGRGFLIMSLMAKHMPKYKKDPATGLTIVNLADIRQTETALTGKEPFRVDEFQQLVKLGYASNLTIKSSTDVYTSVNTETFMAAYQMQKVVLAISAINEQKRAIPGK
ncbi:MAG: cyclic nucleotide-binding domain-containing protein [Oligoflexia bacterium]|nr:cyclic nucleotide-binding domain-containing protein [Oligoflexia bacterium]